MSEISSSKKVSEIVLHDFKICDNIVKGELLRGRERTPILPLVKDIVNEFLSKVRRPQTLARPFCSNSALWLGAAC
jgi:hypothetical protein